MSDDLKRAVEAEKSKKKAKAKAKAEFEKPRGGNDEMLKHGIEEAKAELKHGKQVREAMKDK